MHPPLICLFLVVYLLFFPDFISSFSSLFLSLSLSFFSYDVKWTVLHLGVFLEDKVIIFFVIIEIAKENKVIFSPFFLEVFFSKWLFSLYNDAMIFNVHIFMWCLATVSEDYDFSTRYNKSAFFSFFSFFPSLMRHDPEKTAIWQSSKQLLRSHIFFFSLFLPLSFFSLSTH